MVLRQLILWVWLRIIYLSSFPDTDPWGHLDWPLNQDWLAAPDHSCMTSFLTANISKSSEGRMMYDTSSERSIQGQFKPKIKVMVYWMFVKKHAC